MREYLIQHYCQFKKIYVKISTIITIILQMKARKIKCYGIDIMSMNYICVYFMTHLNIAGLSTEP